jgi:hypothetical protein
MLKDARLAAPEPYVAGSFAKVLYLDTTEPWVEFTFGYKSIGILNYGGTNERSFTSFGNSAGSSK